MDIKVYDFESGKCIAKWNGKEKLSPYLEEYQVAEEKLETCIYNKKPCLCVFMEEKKIRKHAAEELPQTVFSFGNRNWQSVKTNAKRRMDRTRRCGG